MSKNLLLMLFIALTAAGCESEEDEHEEICAACTEGTQKDGCLSKLSVCETSTEEGTAAHEECEDAANDGCQ